MISEEKARAKIEWFINTHGRKDKTFHEPIIAKFVVIFYFHVHG